MPTMPGCSGSKRLRGSPPNDSGLAAPTPNAASWQASGSARFGAHICQRSNGHSSTNGARPAATISQVSTTSDSTL